MNRPGRGRPSVRVELNRDGLSAPWGLRLKGGMDVDGGTPLEITRVINTIRNAAGLCWIRGCASECQIFPFC